MLNIFTIVLDGSPFIQRHLATFEKLQTDWRWVVAEGAAMNNGCTSWCRPQEPRLSKDGTHEYLNSIKDHPNVTVIQRESWNGKVEQCNACLDAFDEEGVLHQTDCDEYFSASQLETIVQQFEKLSYLGEMVYRCRYYVGPDLIVQGDGYGNNSGEWLRSWRFTPGMRFLSHEPPRITRTGLTMDRDATSALGLVFDHLSYVTEAQVSAKELFYGYKDAVKKWKALQAVTETPVRLKDYLDWSDEKATAVRI